MTAELGALQILKRISEVIASNDDIGADFSEIVNILAESLETDVCSIYVLDEEKSDLYLAATCGLNRELVGEIRLKPGDGITGAAFLRREIINVASAVEHESYHRFGNLGEDSYKSFLSSPLLIGSRAVGVLNLQRLVEEKFPDEIVDMVNSLSTQIANLVLSAKMLMALSSLKDGDVKGTAAPPARRHQMLKGVVGNSGIVVGRAWVYKAEESLEGIDPATELSAGQEAEMLDKALRQARKETVELEEVAVSLISEADASIFDVHLMILEDKSLIENLKESIAKGYSLEYAIKSVNSVYQGRFRQMDDEIFREKAADFKDVMLRLLKIVKALKRDESLPASAPETAAGEVVVARELLPSEIFRLASANILGIITEKGSSTSHVAVLAKALNIPALLGVRNLVSHVREDDPLILDGNAGLCHINPDEDVRTRYEEILKAQLDGDDDIDPVCGSGTSDGTQIFLRANISLVSETPLVRKYGACGIGLYRTEFLFMIRDYLPSEDVQYNVFSTVMRAADGNIVSFRLLDIGADKPLGYLNLERETNPALGLRGIRLLLEREEILRPHLRAILRAAALGRARIICPMISGLDEVLSVKAIISECVSQLEREGREHSSDFEFGIMLEVPSAFLQLEELARHVDCVSIGTNDLFQYTFASDRESGAQNGAPEYLEPEFLKLISKAAQIVNASVGVGVSVCGEMAGDPMAAPLLVGAGIRDLSMPPVKIPAVRRRLVELSLDECSAILARCLQAHGAAEVLEIMVQVGR